MASAAPSTPSGAASTGPSQPARRNLWQWLILGSCFGLGYGLTERLVNLQITTGWTSNQRFEVRSFPGTALDALRRGAGETGSPVRADLDLILQERRQKLEAAELERHQAEAEKADQQTIEAGQPGGTPAPGAAVPSLPPETPTLPPAPASPNPPAAPASPPPAAELPAPAAPTVRPPAPTAAPPAAPSP